MFSEKPLTYTVTELTAGAFTINSIRLFEGYLLLRKLKKERLPHYGGSSGFKNPRPLCDNVYGPRIQTDFSRTLVVQPWRDMIIQLGEEGGMKMSYTAMYNVHVI